MQTSIPSPGIPATVRMAGGVLAVAGLLVTASAAPAQDIVRPGDPSLQIERLRTGTDSTRIWIDSAEGRREGPLEIQSVDRIESSGEELLRVTFTLEAERGNVYDTTTFRLPSLTPVRHKSRPAPGRPLRSLDVQYRDGVVTGIVAPPDSAARSFREQVDEPVFDPGLGNVLLAVLPLAAGYEVRVPVFSHESLEVEYRTYRVTGEGELSFRGEVLEVWNVEVSLPSHSFRVSVDKATGRYLGGEMQLGPDLRMVSSPPES